MNLKVRRPFVIESKTFLFRDVLYIYQTYCLRLSTEQQSHFSMVLDGDSF